MSTKTPCIGICSTTSLGDTVCRGCKRYSFEVIAWNGYSDAEKAAVLKRIEKLVSQVLQHKFRIFSVPNLKLGLEQANIPFDESLSPYCWLQNLLKKHHQHIDDLSHYGVYALPEFAGLGVNKLSELIEAEVMTLCQAHLERYYHLPDQLPDQLPDTAKSSSTSGKP